MNMKLEAFKYFYLLSFLFWDVYCELSADEISNLVQIYQMNINSSLTLSRSDRTLLVSWAERHQVQQVNVTTKFRLQMSRHRDHSFKRTNFDKQWNQCMDFYSEDVKRSEHSYYEGELACLKISNEEGKEKRQDVDQVEREIKKWRRSFKYLSHLCEIDNINDDPGAKACLVDYIEKDNYNTTLQRLLLLKLETMGKLYLKLVNSIEHLEECLRNIFSNYLDKVRSLMTSLNKCYYGRNKIDENTS